MLQLYIYLFIYIFSYINVILYIFSYIIYSFTFSCIYSFINIYIQLHINPYIYIQFSSVQSLSRVRPFETPWTAARQASLPITNTWSLLKLMSVTSVMPSNHLILYCPLLLPPSIFPSIRVFSNQSILLIRCPKYWSFSFNINPSNEHKLNLCIQLRIYSLTYIYM